MKYHQLTENERYQIYALNKAGHKQQDIATLLQRNPSTISRELQRNRGLRGYRPGQAQRLAIIDATVHTRLEKLTMGYVVT